MCHILRKECGFLKQGACCAKAGATIFGNAHKHPPMYKYLLAIVLLFSPLFWPRLAMSCYILLYLAISCNRLAISPVVLAASCNVLLYLAISCNRLAIFPVLAAPRVGNSRVECVCALFSGTQGRCSRSPSGPSIPTALGVPGLPRSPSTPSVPSPGVLGPPRVPRSPMFVGHRVHCPKSSKSTRSGRPILRVAWVIPVFRAPRGVF